MATVLKIGDFVPDIQEKLRRDYPRLNQQKVEAIKLVPGSSSPTVETLHRWEFVDKPGTTGFILDSSSFTLHTTDYPTFEPFVEQLRFGVTVLAEVAGVSLVERLGLRYIDLIDPVGGDSIDQYVVSGLGGFPLSDFAGTDCISRTESKGQTTVGHFVAKFAQYRDGTFLPPDLMPVSLPLSKLPQKGTLTALLDLDHYQAETVDFSPEDIVERMWALHDGTSAVFEATVTPFALDRWR